MTTKFKKKHFTKENWDEYVKTLGDYNNESWTTDQYLAEMFMDGFIVYINNLDKKLKGV